MQINKKGVKEPLISVKLISSSLSNFTFTPQSKQIHGPEVRQFAPVYNASAL